MEPRPGPYTDGRHSAPSVYAYLVGTLHDSNECLNHAHVTSARFWLLLVVVRPQRRALLARYVVRLRPEARAQLLACVNTGRAAAAALLHARILLKADVGARSRRRTAEEIAGALDTGATTV